MKPGVVHHSSKSDASEPALFVNPFIKVSPTRARAFHVVVEKKKKKKERNAIIRDKTSAPASLKRFATITKEQIIK